MFRSQIRIDDLSAEKIKFIADQQQRSMNAQIIFIIKQFINDYEKVNGSIKLKTTNNKKE